MWKVRISVLWLFKEVAALTTVILMLFAPGTIGMIETGEIWMGMDPEGMLLVYAIILLVPLVMAFLTLTLKGSVNRWANVILGIVFAGLELFDLTDPMTHKAYVVLLALASFVALALIVWYAWKWPKKEG